MRRYRTYAERVPKRGRRHIIQICKTVELLWIRNKFIIYTGARTQRRDTLHPVHTRTLLQHDIMTIRVYLSDKLSRLCMYRYDIMFVYYIISTRRRGKT